ncbi:MAG: radical SAM protein [Deltaproteobacteria bacterium]|nr:radical SAM protein [Deltaproteobacteria bacterium]
MAGDTFSPLSHGSTRSLPHGSELMFLPDRVPILLEFQTGQIVPVAQNPHEPGEVLYSVAAFNSPGYVISQVPAYQEMDAADNLPLFSYGAVGWERDGFRSAVFQIDTERRQDLRLMQPEKVMRGIRDMKKKMPENRLRKHLEKCAVTYGCPAAKNFFIGRCEAPLPTSPQCNAKCLGCISHQNDNSISRCQDRIAFMPKPDEIAEIALAHLSNVKDGVVSFGQGCEGDPLLASKVIGPAIRRIRSVTQNGTINMNTNGSLPGVLESLFHDGLDAIRVSLNSVRRRCYDRYFNPAGYDFEDVIASIDLAIGLGKPVAINYLNLTGFTDTAEEKAALMAFLSDHPIDQIQWRNLNIDPLRYWQQMAGVAPGSPPMGMFALVEQVKVMFPHLKHGYFNPSWEKIKR